MDFVQKGRNYRDLRVLTDEQMARLSRSAFFPRLGWGSSGRVDPICSVVFVGFRPFRGPRGRRSCGFRMLFPVFSIGRSDYVDFSKDFDVFKGVPVPCARQLKCLAVVFRFRNACLNFVFVGKLYYCPTDLSSENTCNSLLCMRRFLVRSKMSEATW